MQPWTGRRSGWRFLVSVAYSPTRRAIARGALARKDIAASDVWRPVTPRGEDVFAASVLVLDVRLDAAGSDERTTAFDERYAEKGGQRVEREITLAPAARLHRGEPSRSRTEDERARDIERQRAAPLEAVRAVDGSCRFGARPHADTRTRDV